MSTGIIFASIALYKIRTFQVSDLDNEYSGQNYIAFRIITIVSAAVFCLMYLTLATNDSTYLSASLLYLLFKADECFSDVLYGIEQRNERMDYIGKSQIIRGIVSLGGFSIPLALTGNLHMALVCMTVCCMLVTLLYDLGHAHLFGPVRPHIALPKAYSLARACFLAMVASSWQIPLCRLYASISALHTAMKLSGFTRASLRQPFLSKLQQITCTAHGRRAFPLMEA